MQGLDFSEFETTRGGTWQLVAVVDYAAKVCLTCEANGTQTARDATSAVDAAIGGAERLLGGPLKDDLVDRATGEVHPLVIVSDNGPAFKSSRFALFIGSRPELPTCAPSTAPPTNGVIERFFGAIKYENLYREEIAAGQGLVEQADAFRALYNEVRPHEHLDFRTPREVYLEPPESNLFPPESLQKVDSGQPPSAPTSSGWPTSPT